jgi:hypothetical protein
MLNDEVVSAVSKLLDHGKGPRHDELSKMFRKAELLSYDPYDAKTPIGKAERCRKVLSQALDRNPVAGAQLVTLIIGAFKAAGAFRPSSDKYAGDDLVNSVRAAFRSSGYELDPEGSLRPLLLENQDIKFITSALHAYVRRAQHGDGDAALVAGTGKDLLEATARHVLVERTGNYPTHGNFQTTLFQAFALLNLGTPEMESVQKLSSDPIKAMEQSLCLLGMAINKLRNADRSGQHTDSERAFLPNLTDKQARLATQAMGLISEFLLNQLDRQ